MAETRETFSFHSSTRLNTFSPTFGPKKLFLVLSPFRYLTWQKVIEMEFGLGDSQSILRGEKPQKTPRPMYTNTRTHNPYPAAGVDEEWKVPN
jgi:hypothetical protein